MNNIENNTNGIFFEPTVDTYVKTTSGDKKITKLFIKGKSMVFDIAFSDGSMETISDTHRLKDVFGRWVYSFEMKVGDEFTNTNDTSTPLVIVSINQREDFVVDFEVEDVHEYISPNGLVHHNTISFISDVSGGIEPIFALAYSRKIEKEKDRDGKLVYDIAYISDRFFGDYLDKNHPQHKTEILKYVCDNKGSCDGCSYLSKEEQELFKTAQDLKSVEHLDILEATARMTSLSCSKTINLPKTANVKDVSDVYIEAHKRGIIGVTVYRDESRGGILVHDVESDNTIKKSNAPKRPKTLKAEMHQFIVNKQSYYVATGFMGDSLFEVFSGINHNDDGSLYIPKTVHKGSIVKNGKSDYDFIEEGTKNVYHLTNGHSNPECDSLTRSLSTSLRHGVGIDIIVQQLEKTKGSLNSFSKAISRTLKKYIADGVKVEGEKCPKCGSELIRVEGCKKCSDPSCGTSMCG